ncbi:hypothetical protein [Zestomonas carbonaria]|uniref:hypothetical protein n=1 Tax=Zestomonas carbonaria TaxID=2762745 RepID=UPI0016572CEC|nr:hypothetical protein [Pseudomonas carbonaria]
MLDRNVVSDIRMFFDTGTSPNLALARDQDKPYNIISTLSSVLEGGQGNVQSLLDFHETTEQEAKLISLFYRKASVDSEFMLKNTLEAYSSLYQDIRNRVALFSPIIEMAQQKFDLHNTPSKSRALILEQEILGLARSRKIPIRGVPGIGVISAIYGNPHSRKILKPNNLISSDEEKSCAAYNSIYDFEIVKRVLMLRATSLANSGLRVKLVTRDKGLKGFLECMESSKPKKMIKDLAEDVSVEFEIEITEDLFPTLRRNEDRLQLKERMNSWP